MTEEVLEQQSTAELGEALTNAREKAGISIVEMAKKLKLSSNQITALEQGDYTDLGPVTFVKGYIRAYCREFNLDEEQLMTMFFHKKEDSEKKMQSFSRRTEREAKDNHLMLFSYGIIALIIGSSLFIWWQNRDTAKPTNEGDPASLVTETQTEEAATQRLASSSPEKIITEAITSEKTEPEASVVEQSSSDVEPSQHEQLESPANQITEVKTPVKSKLVDTIVMTFKDDSWVEIFDADGERVAFGVKKKGYVMTLEGKAPFNVVLGKHYIVEVKFNDQLVDISNFPTNRLAKFSLPLSE